MADVLFFGENNRASFPIGPIGMSPLCRAPVLQDAADFTGLDRQENVFDVHCKKLLCRLQKIEWDAMLDSQRNAALAKRHRMVMSDPMFFVVCICYFNLVISGLNKGRLQDDPKKKIAGKSTSTLHSRADPMMRFLHYCPNLQLKAFPVFEEVVYSFMQHEEDKVRLLLVAVTANGVSSEFWSQAWKSVLAEAGVQVGHGKPLLPVRTPDGWHPLHWTAEEVTSWLRILRQTGEVLQDSRMQLLGTHSCKSTCLSWLAKWGVTPDMRRLMGYYVADKMSTMLTYGKTTQVPLFVRSMLFWTPSGTENCSRSQPVSDHTPAGGPIWSQVHMWQIHHTHCIALPKTIMASISHVAEISHAFTLQFRPDLGHACPFASSVSTS